MNLLVEAMICLIIGYMLSLVHPMIKELVDAAIRKLKKLGRPER